MTAHRPPGRRRRWDERGATLILVAISMVLLLWGGAFGVDLGLTVVSGRQAQAMADTGALDLARYINIADAQINNGQVLSYLDGKLTNAGTDNGSNTTLTVTPGLWLSGAWSVPSLGCAPTHPAAVNPCNALKVTATQTVPQIFVGGHSSATRTSIAAVTPEAGFSIGSYLASVDPQQVTVLNAILGTLGASVNISTSDGVLYQGLANTSVTINQLVAASAVAGSPLTTSDVMTTSLTGSQWLGIWQAAVASQVAQLNCSAPTTPYPCNASTGLSALNFANNSSTAVQLCQLVSIDGSACSPSSSSTLSTPALATSLNVLQTLTTEAEVANNGTNTVDLGTSLGITGVSDAQLTLGLGQIPQVAFGPVGTTATTAQVSSNLQLSVLGQSGYLEIPLSAASGTVTMKAISCVNNVVSSTKFYPSTTTATGTMTLAGVGIGTVSISGYSIPATSTIPISGTFVPPLAGTPANGGTAGQNPDPIGGTDPTPTYSGLSASSPVYNLLESTMPGVLAPILQAAGVTVGGAEVADLSTNCGAVSLVQ
jgi:uncharacterized membrane protein